MTARFIYEFGLLQINVPSQWKSTNMLTDKSYCSIALAKLVLLNSLWLQWWAFGLQSSYFTHMIVLLLWWWCRLKLIVTDRCNDHLQQNSQPVQWCPFELCWLRLGFLMVWCWVGKRYIIIFVRCSYLPEEIRIKTV